MTKKELNEWFTLVKMIEKRKELYNSGYEKLINLNYSVMEMAHNIHNKNMMEDLKALRDNDGFNAIDIKTGERSSVPF